MLFFVSLGNFLLCMIWEVVVIQNILNEGILRLIRKMRGDIRVHEKIERSILANGLMKGGSLSNAHVSIQIHETENFRMSRRKKDYMKGPQDSVESVIPLTLMPVPDHFKRKKTGVQVSSL